MLKFGQKLTHLFLECTIERYLYIVKPLRYPQIVTHRRVFLAVLAIWITASYIFIVQYVYRRSSFGIEFRSFCDVPANITYFTNAFVGFLLLTSIFLLNFHILCVARKQRRRIFAETTITSVDNSSDKSANKMSFVLRFFVAFKTAKTFAIVVAVLTFCILVPTVIGEMLYKFCTVPCMHLWFVIFQYEIHGINSVVNAFIYGMRHVKCKKAYRHILFKLFSCHKASN